MNRDYFDSRTEFKQLFEYYMNECLPSERDSYISELQKYEIIRYSTANGTECYRGYPNTIYFPTEELKEYFKVKPSTRFVEINDYIELVGRENEKFLCSFLMKLGVSERIRIIDEPMTVSEAYCMMMYAWAHSNGKDEWSESVIDGCSENIDLISAKKIINRSVFFWNTIVDLINNENIDLNNELKGSHLYHFRKWRREWFDSINAFELHEKKWVCTKSGEFVSPSDTHADALAEGYEVSTPAAKRFIKFLKMPLKKPKFS